MSKKKKKKKKKKDSGVHPRVSTLIQLSFQKNKKEEKKRDTTMWCVLACYFPVPSFLYYVLRFIVDCVSDSFCLSFFLLFASYVCGSIFFFCPQHIPQYSRRLYFFFFFFFAVGNIFVDSLLCHQFVECNNYEILLCLVLFDRMRGGCVSTRGILQLY